MITRFWWVRHGPTHAKGFCGWTDLPADLSDTEQIARLAEHLPDQALLVSSDLSRTRQTADALQRSQTRLLAEPDLREFHFGEWEAMAFDEIGLLHPELAQDYWKDPGDVMPPGGESWNRGAKRMNRAVDQLLAGNSGQNIIVVAHFGVILTQLQRAAGISAKATLAFKIDNLSVTQVDYHHGPAQWAINSVNRSF